MAANIDEARQKIDAMYARIQNEDYYKLLGLNPDTTDQASVVQQFRIKAREWHADRWGAVDLDADSKRKIQEIFAALNAAHQTLSDPEKRSDYDFNQQAGDQNIVNIIDAEGAFRRGKTMLQTGSYNGAHEQFRRAVELHPDEEEYLAHFLYTEYLQIPKTDAGVPQQTQRANEIHDTLNSISNKHPETDSILTFLGVVCLGLGQQTKANNLFTAALQHNPRNVEAQRQQRLISMGKERGNNKGFFAKLMEKFRAK